MTEVARLQDVFKSYGSTRALDGVTFALRKGEVHALLGPNGAGKTTAVALLAGLRRPDAGSVELLGGDPQDPAIRRRVGVTPQGTGFPETLRIGEIADFVCRHFPGADAAALLARFDLTELAGRQTGGLSGGLQRRLAVALAFAGDPEVALLDEPTTGLDVESRRRVWESIRAFAAGGGTVLLTTHDMAEVEALARRVTVLNRGRVVADGKVSEVRGLVAVKEVSFEGDVTTALPGAVHVDCDDGRTKVLTSDADALVHDLVCGGHTFRDLQIRAASLEEAFLSLTGADR